MEFVVNEWLPEYFKPNASTEEKRKLEKFLFRFIENNDTIIVRRPSEFLRKLLRYANDYQRISQSYNVISKFISLVVLDSNRCRYVDDGEFILSQEIIDKLNEKGNYSSDTYLFEAASVTSEKLIITTDVKLKIHMENNGIFNVILLDEFLINY
jgi:hypothetical protein